MKKGLFILRGEKRERTGELKLGALRLHLPHALRGSPPDECAIPRGAGGRAADARAHHLVVEHAPDLERLKRKMTPIVDVHPQLEGGVVAGGTLRRGHRDFRRACDRIQRRTRRARLRARGGVTCAPCARSYNPRRPRADREICWPNNLNFHKSKKPCFRLNGHSTHVRGTNCGSISQLPF